MVVDNAINCIVQKHIQISGTSLLQITRKVTYDDVIDSFAFKGARKVHF